MLWASSSKQQQFTQMRHIITCPKNAVQCTTV